MLSDKVSTANPIAAAHQSSVATYRSLHLIHLRSTAAHQLLLYQSSNMSAEPLERDREEPAHLEQWWGLLRVMNRILLLLRVGQVTIFVCCVCKLDVQKVTGEELAQLLRVETTNMCCPQMLIGWSAGQHLSQLKMLVLICGRFSGRWLLCLLLQQAEQLTSAVLQLYPWYAFHN
jgi:hypothetical protein